MKKALSLILALVLCVSLCACSSGGLHQPTQSETPKYLTQREAKDRLISVAEPQLADAIGIPSYAFKMDSYTITKATHYEELGYWYFEVEGKIPMYDDGLWYIHYSFDAKVNDKTGKVTLGTLTKDY